MNFFFCFCKGYKRKKWVTPIFPTPSTSKKPVVMYPNKSLCTERHLVFVLPDEICSEITINPYSVHKNVICKKECNNRLLNAKLQATHNDDHTRTIIAQHETDTQPPHILQLEKEGKGQPLPVTVHELGYHLVDAVSKVVVEQSSCSLCDTADAIRPCPCGYPMCASCVHTWIRYSGRFASGAHYTVYSVQCTVYSTLLDLY